MGTVKEKGATAMVYVIIADGVIDQTCETMQDAKREIKDLRAMGCVVTMKPFNSWEEAEEYEDNYNATH